jgi:hypothetical protein
MFLPPVGSFSMTGFESVDRIIACGYAYGLEHLQRWADDDAFVQRLGSAGIRLRG